MKTKIIRDTNLYRDTGLELLTDEKSKLSFDSGMVFFEREVTEKLLRAIEAYNSGAKVSAIAYERILKRKRGEMHAVKNGGGR